MSFGVAGKLKSLENGAMTANPGGNILAKVGNGLWATGRTAGLAIATGKVGEETYKVARDMVSGAPQSTWEGQLGHRALGGVGEFLMAGSLAMATYEIGLLTAHSAVLGVQQVQAA
jgi:hypothetical protein